MYLCRCFRVAFGVSCPRRFVLGWIKTSLVFMSAFGAGNSALAASGTWSSTATTSAWQTSTNWVSGIIPGATSGTTNTDTATFNNAGNFQTFIAADAGRNLENITFDTAAASYNIGGANTILLTSGGTIQIASTISDVGTFQTISASLALEGNYTFANNANSGANDTLAFGGAISSGVAGIQTLTFAGTGSVVAGGAAIGGGTGTIAVVKNGAGTLILNGNDTFTGGVTINAGTLQVGSAGALNSSGVNAVTFGSGSAGTLFLNGTSIAVSGLSSSGGTPIVQNSSSFSPVALTVNNAGANTYGGVLQDGGNASLALVKGGAGTLTLSGNNAFRGGVTINAGSLQLGSTGALNSTTPNAVTFGALSTGSLTLAGNSVTVAGLNTSATVGTPAVENAFFASSTLTVNNAGNNTFAGVLRNGAGLGSLSLTKTGAGTLVLGGANTFTGAVNVNNGTLELAESTGTQAVSGSLFIGDGVGAPSSAVLLTDNSKVFPSSGANVTIQSDGVLNFGSASIGETINTLNMTGGLITGGGGGFPLTLQSDLTTNASSNTANIAAAGYFVVLSGPTRTFTVAQGTTPTGIDLDIAAQMVEVNIANPTVLVKNGPGTMRLSGPNGFTGGVNLNAGTLIIGNTSALGSGTLTVGGGTLQADSNGPYTLANPINLVGTLTVSGSNNLAFIGPISGNGGLTKIGSSTLTLTGANSFTGPVNVNGGTLVITGGPLTANVQNQATFVYNSGTFTGRLTNLGTVTLNADFTAGNGMENDGNFSLFGGRTVTLNGAGLDNEGTFTMSGGVLNLNPAGSNVNRGNFNLSANLGLGTATLTNSGTLALSGGLVSGASGTLVNTFGGTVSGTGSIQSIFNNSGGVFAVGNGTLNVAQAFANGGVVQLNSISANLAGGAITNTNMIQGFGNVGNAVTNNGNIQALGGTLFVSGALSNSVSGMLTAGTGNELFITAGLAANPGIINLTGGIFDNGGHSLNNTGQVSGWGIFRTGGSGLDNNGSITFSGGLTTVNGPVTNEGGKTITVAQNPAIFTGMVTNNMTATFTTVNATATFAGGFTNNGNSNFAAVGNGAINVPVAPAFGNASSLAIGGASAMRFSPVSGAATVGTGVTTTVSSSAMLELAGTVSALSSGVNRVNVTNNSSAAAGILVSGTNQVVGNIDGSGNTVVNAGSDLTANHIIQSALVIGGTAGSHGLVTIDASDASGNPLGQSSGLALAGSLTPSEPFGAVGIGSADLNRADNTEPAALSPGNSAVGGNPSPVPEPSTLVLMLLAISCVAGQTIALWRRGR